MLDKISISTAIVLIFVASLILVGDEKPFSISKSLPKQNTNQRLAVDSDKRNVLVVWGQDDKNDNDYGRVYAAFCKWKKGSFLVKAPFLLSPTTGRHGKPEVAFDPVNKRFLVAWDTRQIEQDRIVNETKIIGRIVNRSGKPVGPSFTILDQKANDDRINLCPANSLAAPPGGAAFLLLWNHDPLDWGKREEVGLYSALLNSSGKIISSIKRILKGKYQDDTGGSTGKRWYFGFAPNKTVYCPDGNYFMSIVTQVMPPIANKYWDIHLAKIDSSGNLVNSVRLDTKSAYAGRLAMLSPNLFMAAWYKDGKTTGYLDRRYLPSLKPKKKAFSPLTGGEVRQSDIVKLGKNKGSYQVCSVHIPGSPAAVENDKLYGLYVNSKGKIIGDPRLLFDHQGYLWSLRAAAIPGKNDVFIAWEKWINNEETEIWGLAFSAK